MIPTATAAVTRRRRQKSRARARASKAKSKNPGAVTPPSFAFFRSRMGLTADLPVTEELALASPFSFERAAISNT